MKDEYVTMSVETFEHIADIAILAEFLCAALDRDTAALSHDVCQCQDDLRAAMSALVALVEPPA